jgi:hypothetical protein
MVRLLVQVSIAATLLSLLAHFYMVLREDTYTSEHGANAFEVTLWRIGEPGEFLAIHILPDWYTNYWGAEEEVLEHRARVFGALAVTLNALFWSAVASIVVLIHFRLRRRARTPTI